MSKLFNSLALLLIVLSFASCQEKKAEANVPKWILSMVSDSKNTSAETDFSNILSDKSVPYIGYIGTDYQKFSIDIQKVQRTDDNQYDVSGITVVKNNRCNFRGTIDIVENREFTHPTYGVDDSMKGQFKRRGCSIAKYNLEEETSQTGSGVFTGYCMKTMMVSSFMTISIVIRTPIVITNMQEHGKVTRQKSLNHVHGGNTECRTAETLT